MNQLPEASETWRLTAELAMSLGNHYAGEAERKVAAGYYLEAWECYSQAEMPTHAGKAWDLASESARLVRPSFRPNISALVD